MTYICIVCPVSCRVTVEEKDGLLTVEGNRCPKGKQYALNEHKCPKRMLTTTVKIKNALLRRAPVVSTAEVPKDKLKECLDELYKIELKAPVSEGELVIKDICGTSVDIVAARSMKSI